MKLDFKLLEDIEWIRKREEQWELIAWRYSDELTRKEREALKRYFIKGVFPEIKSYPLGYITLLKLFPFQSKEGHAYVFRNFPVRLDWTRKNLNDFLRHFLLENSELLTFEERLNQFKWYMGGQFDSLVKFPFLIGQETDYRVFDYDTRLFLMAMLKNLDRWLVVDSSDWEWWDTNNLEHCLIDFIFSLLKAQVDFLSEESNEKSHNNHMAGEKKNFFILINSLMNKAFIKNINDSNEDCKNIKILTLKEFENKFNSMSEIEFPKILVEHWGYVKRRNIIVLVSFTMESNLIEQWVEFYVRWHAALKSYSTILERETTLNFLSHAAIEKFESLESYFSSGDIFFEDVGASFDGDNYNSIFSASSIEAVNHLEAFLVLCTVNNFQIKLLPIG